MRRLFFGWAIVACAPIALGQEADRDRTLTVQGQVYEIYPAEKLRQRGMEVPEVPFEENAAWKYVEAINAMVKPQDDLVEEFTAAQNGTWPEGEAGERLAAWLAESQPALELFRQASEMPDYHMPLCRGDTDSLMQALLPTISPIRQLSKTLTVEATFLMSQGKASEALDNYLTAQRVAAHVGHGQTLIEGLVGIAIRNLADQGLMRVAETGQVDSDRLKEAISEMDRLAEAMPTFEEMVRAEQRFSTSIVDDIIELPGTFTLLNYNGMGALDKPEANGWSRLRGALMRLYLPDRTMKRNFNRHYDTLVEATRPREDGAVGEILEEEELLKQVPAWDVVSRMMLPSLSRVHEMTLRDESNLVRTKLTMAAEAYRQDRGRPPATLATLAPEYVSQVPVDPMTGYDFDYQPAADDGSPQGLGLVTRESAEELRKKRRTPAILNPRESKWRRYTRDFVMRYQLSDKQRAAAESVLRDVEARAAAFERAQGARIQQLMEAGESEEAARRMGPVHKLFDELKKRLDALPTAKQRAAVKSDAKNDVQKEKTR